MPSSSQAACEWSSSSRSLRSQRAPAPRWPGSPSPARAPPGPTHTFSRAHNRQGGRWVQKQVPESYFKKIICIFLD